MTSSKNIRGFILLSLVLVFWIVTLSFISPEAIVQAVGIKGGYLLVFFTALLGISGLSSASFYSTLLVLASTGEFHPIALGLVAAPAATLGDFLFFFWGMKGRSLVSSDFLEKIAHWLKRRPRWLAPTIAYFYTGFSPLPQDILMIIFGVGGVRFATIMPFLFLGNVTFVSTLSYFAFTAL